MRHRLAALVICSVAAVTAACTARPQPGRAPGAGADTSRGAAAAADGLPAALTAAGVSLELALHRAATLADVHYALRLDVTEEDRAAGVVDISLVREPDAGDLLLDFRGLSLDHVRANGGVVDDFTWDRHHVRIPRHHLVTGPNTLRLAFTAPIAPAGAAIIAYDDRRDEARYLYTLLVPSDAQLLFPVFDQPDIKARFTWHLTTPSDWTVVTNAPLVERVDEAGGARTRHEFATTDPISPYVAAFAAGPWAALRHEADDGSEIARDMTLYVRRARTDEVDADTLLRLNRDALSWLERYFDSPYPFGKLDLVLAPAFPFGGMEHAGAIFYNESNFIFREPPTPSRRLGRAATIYHEMAHQWFGDLVTMRWFDDLWLKEGFSTFMAARIQQDLHPEADAWKTFYLRNKPAAYAVDVTAGTTPVWQELPNLDLAKSNYGAIVYNKAPSVLKQLEFLVGEEPFRQGMQIFLRRHAFGNATWRDLLDAIGEAAEMDLTTFGEQYILRPGLPRVETELELTAEGRIASLALVQQPAGLAERTGDAAAWPGRVRVRLGYEAAEDVVIDVAFDGERTAIDAARGLAAPEFVFPNDGDHGYGIFLPDARSADWLLENAAGLQDELLRAMSWGALWDLVRETRLPPGRYVRAALPAYAAEADEQIAGRLLWSMGMALERYMPATAAADSLRAAVEEMLLARIADDDVEYGLRRGALDALLGRARSPRALRSLREFLAEERTFDGEPLRQPSRWAAVTRLLALGEPDAHALYGAEQARDSTPEAERMAFIAGAAVPDPAVKSAYWERYFEDESLNEEWVTASLGAFNHDLHEELSLPWLRPALERTEWLRDNRRIFFLPRWIGAFIGGHASPEALRIVDDYLEANPGLPGDVRRRILQARDELARTVRIRAAAAGAAGPR